MRDYRSMNDKTISHLVIRNVLDLTTHNTDAETFAASGCRVMPRDIHRKGDASVWFDPTTSEVDAVQLVALYCTRFERYATIDETDGLTYVAFSDRPKVAPLDHGHVNKCRAICEAVLFDHALLRAKKPSP